MAKVTIKQIMISHWYNFVNSYSLKKKFRPIVLSEVERIMKCADPQRGYILFECPHCNQKLKLPLRCKSRFCSSCGAAYQQDRSASISAKLLSCKHRHIVFTIAEELRFTFNGIVPY